MAASRKPGSKEGRPLIDWEAAFVFYASLPDPTRSYQAVAAHYGVSVRTVEKHGRTGRWRERVAQIQASAAESADAQLAEQRAAKLAELELLIEAVMTTFAHQLRAGTVKVVPADLLRLFKLREELWAQAAAENAQRHATQAANQQPDEDLDTRNLEIARALYEAGAFDRLKALVAPPEPHADEPEDANEETA